MTTRTSSESERPALSHEPFLERAHLAEGLEQQRALGAFLTLRLVDQLKASRRQENDDALRYQLKTTAEYVRALPSNAIDAEHLRHIVRACEQGIIARSYRALWPPMLAFAFWLEKDLQLDEARDVLSTLLQLHDGSSPGDCVAAIRQQARVFRLLGRFEEARAAYDWGERLAIESCDQHSAFVLRIGRAILTQKTGNLPESERQLRAVIGDAQAAGDRMARAMATHDLAIALHLAHRTADAVPLAFLAYELYEDRLSRQRALSDTGVLLKEMGHLDAARKALHVVLDENPSKEVRSRVVLELIEVSAHACDRFSFERWRREAESLRDVLPIDEVCNLELALGSGLAAFGAPDEAARHLENAIAIAEQGKLGERLHKAECALRELGERRAVEATLPEPEHPSPELRGTIERVMALAG